MTTVYLNGEFKPLAEANINVLDRGFTFGDGVYEVIPVFNRKVFRFNEHIERLNNSLHSIYMDNPLANEKWAEIFSTLIAGVTADNQSIYVQITRGISERDHDISLSRQATVFAMSRPLVKKDMTAGIKIITHEDIRWSYCDIKAITLLPSVLLRHRAKLVDAKEALLIRGNQVTEGAASNVFICKDGKIFTPPKDRLLLPGITRDLLLELLVKNKLDYAERIIHKDELVTADEIWMTSSTWEIVPVTELNDKPVGQGKVGKLWHKVNSLYQDYKHSLIS